MDRCGYWVSVGNTIGSGLRYIVDGHELLLRAAYLMISDGVNEAHLAISNPNATGFIVPGSPSLVRFPAAFGPGYDLEYVAEKGGFHQNLIIAERPLLPPGLDAGRAAVHLYTQMNLDEYLTASGLGVLVDGEEINAVAPDLLSPPSVGGCISFHRPGASPGEAGQLIHAFAISSVADSSALGTLPKETVAQKRLLKDRSTKRSFLVESLPFAYFAEEVSFYPVIWDYVNKSGPIGTETWEPRFTYWVSDNVSVTGTLSILPGTTVKLNPSKKISILTGATVVAKGVPYNYMTFTKASDSNCGETIPGAPPGPWDRVFDISSGSSAESAIRYCKFGHGNIGIDLRQSLSQDNRVEHNVFSDMFCAMQIQGCSATVHNNLMASCTAAIYTNGIGTGIFSNNTIDNMGGGILDGGSSVLIVKDSLFSNSPNGTGIYTYNGAADIQHNRFFNVYTWIAGPPGHDNQGLNDPYDHDSAVGGYFLSTYGADNLKNAGSRNADQEPRLDGEVFAIRAPYMVSGTQSGQVTWDKICYQQGQPYSIDTGTVCIGYHHSRVDRYVPDNCTVSGSQSSLTVLPGVVVGIRGDKYLMITGGAKLVSVGHPDGGGLNLFTNSKSLSMNIESPRFADLTTNPYVSIAYGASTNSRIEFARTTWLGLGVMVTPRLNAPIRDNVFSLSYFGVHAGTPGNILLNNLAHENAVGLYAAGNAQVANCTLDRNSTGLRVFAFAGETLHIKDCLFTKNSAEGIRIDSGTGQVLNYYNGFWANTNNIQGGSLGPGSQILAESPYYAPIETGWQLHYKLKQDEGWPVTNSPVSAGSCWAPDPLEGPHPYSTSVYADRDVGRIDIGFHFTFYDNTDGDHLPDAWETEYFHNLDQGDGSTAGDGDALTALQEFWHGSSPNVLDSDGDGYNDPEEVGVQEKRLLRGWGPAVPEFMAGPWLTNVSSSGITIAWWVPDGASAPCVYYKKESESSFAYWKDPSIRDDGIVGKVYEKRLTGLSSGTAYHYYVRSSIGDIVRTSPVCKFRTLESSPSSFNFIVYGDNRGENYAGKYNNNGFNEYAAEVVRGILSKAPQARFVLHVGDFTKAGGDPYSEQWRQHFFLPTTRLIAECPVFPARGNHDSSLAYYDDFFDYPGDLNNAGYPTWYDFHYGGYHFVVMDSEAPYQSGSTQYANLSQWLGESAAYTLFVGHRPPYNDSDGHRYSEGDPLRTSIVPLLQANHAEAHFAGHSHLYERWELGAGDPDIDYFVIGGGGAPLHYSEHVDPEQYPDRKEKTPQGQEYYNFGVVAVTPQGCTVTVWDKEGIQGSQHVVTPY